MRAPDGRIYVQMGTLDEWIANAERGFAHNGFYEKEIARRAESFGRIAHVFSTYASRRAPADSLPFARGINSFQLVKTAQGWKVMTILWDAEREGNPLPEKYLTTSK